MKTLQEIKMEAFSNELEKSSALLSGVANAIKRNVGKLGQSEVSPMSEEIMKKTMASRAESQFEIPRSHISNSLKSFPAGGVVAQPKNINVMKPISA